MKYVPPLGRESEGEAAHYINGNPVEGLQGSIPDAKSWEHPLRELTDLVKKSKQTPDGGDLQQVLKGVRSQRMNYVEDTGSVNNLSVSLDPALAEYSLGLILHVRIRETNNGASSIDAGAGRVPIKLMNGGGTGPGDLPAGGLCALCYDGAAFQLLNFFGLGGGAGGDTTNYYIKIPYAVDTSSTPNIIIAPFAPAITELLAGDAVLVKVKNTNSSGAILRVNALPDVNITANGGGPLIQGDIVADDVCLFIFDGTNFYLLSPNTAITANVTLSVPSQFATIDAALTSIRRKVIASTATVTIQLAQGVFPPFAVNHPYADRIVIKGTMKAAAPVYGNFAVTGSSPSARASDSANNIVMLRSRYGTEIQCPASPPNRGACVNQGAGILRIADLLITGPNYAGSSAMGVFVDLDHSIRSDNVACWGLDIGWYGAGSFWISSCHASGCFSGGGLLTGPGGVGAYLCNFVGNGWGGFSTNQNGMAGLTNCNAGGNGSIGFGAGDNSEMTLISCGCYANGFADVYSSILSEVLMQAGSVYSTSSPAAGSIGNYGAVFIYIP